jgi:hypothetical protein
MKPVAAHTWDRDPDNWYTEPTWVSRRLFDLEDFPGRVMDPCAGMGHIVQGGREAGVSVEGFDLRDRDVPNVRGGFDFFDLRDRGVPDVRGGFDFFDPDAYCPGHFPVDHIVSNPPYGAGTPRLEERFIDLALTRARTKVAVFLPTVWAVSRGLWLDARGLYRVYLCSPRPSCPPGASILAGQKPGGGKVDYAWYVFLKGYTGHPALLWLRRDE